MTTKSVNNFSNKSLFLLQRIQTLVELINKFHSTELTTYICTCTIITLAPQSICKNTTCTSGSNHIRSMYTHRETKYAHHKWMTQLNNNNYATCNGIRIQLIMKQSWKGLLYWYIGSSRKLLIEKVS